MPRVTLDPRLIEVRKLTGLTMEQIRDTAMVEYLATFNFKKARGQRRKQRRDLIRYAVKKHGTGAAKVLSVMGEPVRLSENEFYRKCLDNRWKYR